MINASNLGKWDEAKDKEIDKWWRMEVQAWRKGSNMITTTWVCTQKGDEMKGGCAQIKTRGTRFSTERKGNT